MKKMIFLLFPCLLLLLSLSGNSEGGKRGNDVSAGNGAVAEEKAGADQETAAGSGTGEYSRIFGKWRIVDWTGSGYIFSDSVPAKAYIGGTLTIQKDRIEAQLPLAWLSGSLTDPEYVMEMQDRNEFFEMSYADYDSFGFQSGDSVPYIQVHNAASGEEWDSFFGGDIWIKDEDHIVVLGTMYYLAERIEDEEGEPTDLAEADNKKAHAAYQKAMKDRQEINGQEINRRKKNGKYRYPYAFFDIDGNGIDELIVSGYLNSIYTYQKGKVRELLHSKYGSYTFYPDAAVVLVSEGHMDQYEERYVRTVGTEARVQGKKSWEVEHITDGQWRNRKEEYKVKGKSVGKSQYQSYVTAVEKGRAVALEELAWQTEAY